MRYSRLSILVSVCTMAVILSSCGGSQQTASEEHVTDASAERPPQLIGAKLLTASQFAASQDCGAILANGDFDVAASSSDTEPASSFVHWYSAALQNSSSSAASGGLSFLRPIGFFGANGSDTSQESMSQSFQAYQSGDDMQIQKLASFSRRASKVLADAWLQCMKTYVYGLNVSTQFTSDPNVFFLVFQFNPTDPIHHPSTKLTALRPSSSNVVCTPKVTHAVRISAAPQPFQCTRSDNKQSVAVSYVADDATNSNPVVNFPAYERNAPPAAPQCNSMVMLTDLEQPGGELSATVKYSSDASAADAEVLVDGKINSTGVNSGGDRNPTADVALSDITLTLSMPEWVHHLILWPISIPTTTHTVAISATLNDGKPIPIQTADLRFVNLQPIQVNFPTAETTRVKTIRIVSSNPSTWVAWTEMQVFVCRP